MLIPGWPGPPRGLVRLTPEAPTDPRLLVEPEVGPASRVLARSVSVALWFTDNDVGLHHCLKDLFPFGLVPLSDPVRRVEYQSALIDRYRTFAEGNSRGPRAGPWPPGLTWTRPSTRSRLCRSPRRGRGGATSSARPARPSAVRDRVQRDGHAVAVRELVGECASAARYAEDRDLLYPTDKDPSVAWTEPPGHILRCLRLYLKIDRSETRGRVLYRPC